MANICAVHSYPLHMLISARVELSSNTCVAITRSTEELISNFLLWHNILQVPLAAAQSACLLVRYLVFTCTFIRELMCRSVTCMLQPDACTLIGCVDNVPASCQTVLSIQPNGPGCPPRCRLCADDIINPPVSVNSLSTSMLLLFRHHRYGIS